MMFGNEVPAVRPGEVAARVAEGWMLLDVRTDDEWAGGRIAGSVHIPMDQLMQRLGEVDDRVVCVCAVGARSARVAQFLNAQGREAVNLDGGIYAWANSGLPIEVDAALPARRPSNLTPAELAISESSVNWSKSLQLGEVSRVTAPGG